MCFKKNKTFFNITCIYELYMYLYIIIKTNNMENLLNRIGKLENKRDNGTITMDESTTLCRLIELAEKFISR